jgi:uncharacterized glyoxalase superfamily protein PhnB
MITGAHSIIYSKNPDADRAFLRDVLKLPHADAGAGWLIFGLPAAEVAFHPSDQNNVHEFYLLCDDIKVLIAALRKSGAACSPVQNRAWGYLTQVALPGGGSLGIYQPRHAQPKAMSPRTRTPKVAPQVVTPYLYYEDVDRALAFLARAFGFRKHGAPVRGQGGKAYHAAMKLGDAQVMMGRPAGGYRNPKRLGQTTQSLYIDVTDVDKHCQRARKAGAGIIEEPTDTDYGHRRYGATDPEGHVWYFARDMSRPKPKRKPTRARQVAG